MPRREIPEERVQEAIEREFECHRCGACCKGEGAVHVGPAEVERMAEHLGLNRREFLRRFAIRLADEEWMLTEKPNVERWCVFLERDAEGLYGCSVNPVKPDQCRSYPMKWRNDDSYRTCAGLKALLKKLRTEA
jgi:hypothetical protein